MESTGGTGTSGVFLSGRNLSVLRVKTLLSGDLLVDIQDENLRGCVFNAPLRDTWFNLFYNQMLVMSCYNLLIYKSEDLKVFRLLFLSIDL